MDTVPGLAYEPDFVSPEEEQGLLAALDREPWMTSLRRRVQHYGYRYDYKARAVHGDMYLGPLPAWAEPLVARLRAVGVFSADPDQLIVNEYTPGQGISPHIDCVPCFGPVVAVISLGSACVMEFSRTRVEETKLVLLQARSLLVLREDARYRWRHAIRPRRSDRWEGVAHTRSLRISLTFRTVQLSRGDTAPL